MSTYSTFDSDKHGLHVAHVAEDGALPWATRPANASGTRAGAARRAVAVVVLVLLGVYTWQQGQGVVGGLARKGGKGVKACGQVEPLKPAASDKLDAHKAQIFSPHYREHSAAVLSGFVRVRSESFDDLGPVAGPGRDPRWSAFEAVPAFLERTFPHVHGAVRREMVNTHGLLLTWEGSDKSLKPILLTGHQDTVPVNPSTLDQWEHPPFEGVYDGTFVHGRGSIDCKNSVSAILEAWELLIAAGFAPRRTVLFASGFDEESGGVQGAGALGAFLEARYGRDSLALVWDEGGMGFDGRTFGEGRVFALPATGEKGFANVNFTLSTPGGHSSMPPAHTGIGILSELVRTLERHPFAPKLGLATPTFGLLTCAAEHGHLPRSLRNDVLAGTGPSALAAKARARAAAAFAALGLPQRFLVQTSQATDIIRSGVKVNALPELGFVTVNYRVSVDESVAELEASVAGRVLPVAREFGLDVVAFGKEYSFRPEGAGASAGRLVVETTGANEVAPVSPSAASDPAWAVFAGSIRHAYEHLDEEVVVAPSLMTGGTDTKFYWNLSRNIWRFTPMDKSRSFGQHTVGEKLFFDDHIGAVWLFHELIRNADAAEL